MNRYTNPAPTHFKDTFKNRDLATAYYISDRIIVMQKGIVVESGEERAVLNAPQHPYSRQLRAAVLLPEVAAAAPSATLSP